MKLKSLRKKGLAFLLALTMVTSVAPVSALADEAPITETVETETVIETPVADDSTVVETAETPAATDEADAAESTDEAPIDEETAPEEIVEETENEEIISEETTEATEEASDEIADEIETDAEEADADVEEAEEQEAEKELSPEELAAIARAELLATSPVIIADATANNVTVHVNAPEGAFPGGTSVVITPVYQLNELVDAIDSVSTSEGLVAFDITFYDIDGIEIQPRDGYTVQVSFELEAASELAQDDATLQVYHIDDAQNATPVGEEIASSSDGVEVSVDAESFSVYAITIVPAPVEVCDVYYMTVGQTMTFTKSLKHLYTKDIQVKNDSCVNVSANIVDKTLVNDDANITITAVKAGDTDVEINYQYLSLGWHDDSLSFKVHVAEPQKYNIDTNNGDDSIIANIVLGGFTVNEKIISNWLKKVFGKPVEEAVHVTYDNGNVVTASVIEIVNGYSIFNKNWAEKAAVARVQLTPCPNATKNSDTVHLSFDVIGGCSQTVSFDVTVDATHTVTFNPNGGSLKEKTQTVNQGECATECIPTRNGYVFQGWYNGDEKYDFNTPVTSDLTLIAKWLPVANFFIRLDRSVIDTNNNIASRPIADYSASVATCTLGAIIDTKEKFVGEIDNIQTTDKDLREKYFDVNGSQPKYIQGYPGDDAIFSKLQIDKKTNENFSAKGLDITKLNSENYNIYWYVFKHESDGWHVDGIIRPKNVELVYDANIVSGEAINVPTATTVSYGAVVTVASGPSCKGYDFTGWNTGKKGDGISYNDGAEITLTEEKTVLYAQWKEATSTEGTEGETEGGTVVPNPPIVPDPEQPEDTNGGGGSSVPSTPPTTPVVDTPENIPEDDVPLADTPDEETNIPEDDVPLADTPDETSDIQDDDVPLADTPDETSDIQDDEVPLADTPDETSDIQDDEVPLADLPDDKVPLSDSPKTGDNTSIWLFAAFVAGLGLVFASRKRKDEISE